MLNYFTVVEIFPPSLLKKFSVLFYLEILYVCSFIYVMIRFSFQNISLNLSPPNFKPSPKS